MGTFFKTRRRGRSRPRKSKSASGESKPIGKMFFSAAQARFVAERSVVFPDTTRRGRFWKSLGKRRQADIEKMLNTQNCNDSKAKMNKKILIARHLANSSL